MGSLLVPITVATSPLQQTPNSTPRSARPRCIFLHTSTGQRVEVITLSSADRSAEQLNAYFGRIGRRASSDYQVDGDSIAISNNILQRFAWGQGAPNAYSISIEMAIRGSRLLDTRTIANTATLVHVLTAALRIQRQCPWREGQPFAGVIERFRPGDGGGVDCTGVFAHRNVAFRGERGFWDSGNLIFEALDTAGYERFDFNARQDLDTWRGRQSTLGVEADGVPGLSTSQALEAQGKACGLWIDTPGGCSVEARAVIDQLLSLRTHHDPGPRRRTAPVSRRDAVSDLPASSRPATTGLAGSWWLPASLGLGAIALLLRGNR